MKIPLDLKPGDKLWYSETEFATVCGRYSKDSNPYLLDEEDERRGRVCAEDDKGTFLNIWCDTGSEIYGDCPPIIRVERIKSKLDKDAVWLKWLADRQPVILGPAQLRRLRALSKRLNGGKLP